MARIWFQRAADGYRTPRGELVRRLQTALSATGSGFSAVDGVFGRDTEWGIRDFQQRNGLVVDGKIGAPLWTALLSEPQPLLFHRCLQLTAAFEGHGFQKVVGNFDGAGLTWGIIAFTLKHGGVQDVLTEILRTHPALVDQAFGALRPQLEAMLKLPRAEQVAWADGLSLGPRKLELAPEWRTAFESFGGFPEVQAAQITRAGRYWNIAQRDVQRFKLNTELGMALCFDVAVQNGGVDFGVEGPRIAKALETLLEPSQRDVRLAIADAVAENSRPEYVEDVRRRKQAIAVGDGEVHGARYATADWGLADEPLA